MTSEPLDTKQAAPLKEYKALSQDGLRQLIRETVGETLAGLGFSTETPAALQADMLYLRRWREGMEEVRRIIVRSLLTMSVSAALYLLWQALR